MQNMERRKFEESWKEAFAQAEISPSENVWTNVELDLEKAKGDRLKKRLVFYQLLAAASVVFAMGVGIAVYVVSNDTITKQHLALQQPASANPSQQKASPAESKKSDLKKDQAIENVLDQSNNNTAENDVRSNDRNARSADQTVNPAESTKSDLEKNQVSENAIVQSNKNTAVNDVRSDDRNSRSTDQTQPSTVADFTVSEKQKTDGRSQQSSGKTFRKGETIQVANGDEGNSLPPTLTNSMHSSSQEQISIAREEKNVEGIFSPSLNRPLPALVENQKIALHVSGAGQQEAAPDPVALMLAKLAQRENEISQQKAAEEKEKSRDGENLWTSIGFATGSFSSVNSKAPDEGSYAALDALNYGSNLQAGSANTYASVADKETKASGVTYSMGVNIGTKLSERWVFQGGVNYLSQSSEYTQDNLLPNDDFTSFKPLTINDIDKMSMSSSMDQEDVTRSSGARNAIVNTPPHNVNNNVRYLSIPLQAGYLVVNRDFGVQLNAGVATDLFLQNTITATADGEKVDPAKAGIGEDSAFRPINLSGLMGTEVSYKFGSHYRIALNPGLRYPFSSIYKSDDYKATRLTFDVGLRFRYIFH
jgi:hypothetical protein